MESSVILESSTTCWLSQSGWKGVCRIAHTGTGVQHGNANQSWAFYENFQGPHTDTQTHIRHISVLGVLVWTCVELLEGFSLIYLLTTVVDEVLHTCQSKGNLNACVLLSLWALPQWYVLKSFGSMHGHGGVTPWYGWVCFLGKAFTEPKYSFSMCILPETPCFLSIHLSTKHSQDPTDIPRAHIGSPTWLLLDFPRKLVKSGEPGGIHPQIVYKLWLV